MPTKKGPKIKELASLLEITSKELLQKCADAGMHFQNSVTRLTEDEAEQIVRLIRPDSAT